MFTISRAFARIGILCPVLVGLGSGVSAPQTPPLGTTSAAEALEPGAAARRTWVLSSAHQFRLPPPPDAPATIVESAELRKLASQRDAAARERIQFWDAGAPSYRWVDLAVDRILQGPTWGLNAARHVALVNVAVYDATVAAWDSKYAYRRARPSAADASLTTVLSTPGSPSYPCEHAVTAGAAAEMLAYLYPAEARIFREKAEEAARSRLLAGVAYPGDVRAGLELGRAVAARIIERAKEDGFDRQWTGTVPTGPGVWTATNPMFPLAGTWKTWVITSGSELRPGPPPAHDSPQKAAELAEIKNFKRTFDTNAKAFFANTGEGITGQWYRMASRWVFEDRLDTNVLRVARIYALMSVAHHDAMVACWDAKYAYWAIRPHQLDPTITTLFPTPPHPSYPAAHACGSAAMAAVLAHLFPRRGEFVSERAEENAESRLWAGIHYRSDIQAGLALGRAVAERVVEWSRRDGSQ